MSQECEAIFTAQARLKRKKTLYYWRVSKAVKIVYILVLKVYALYRYKPN